MGDSTTLLFRFLGIDEGAGRQFDKMAAKTGLLGKESKKSLLGMSGLATGVTLAGAVIAGASVKMAADYQRSMTLIQTQAGASKAEVESFSKSLLSMAGQVAQSPEALSVSLYHVYSALKKVGATAPQMLNTVKIAAEGAKVGNTDLEDTTNSLTATLASGIVKFNEASKAMGYLNAIVGAGDMHFSDLNQALGTGLLVTMKTFGVSLKDTGAALAVFGDNNIRGADAATKLRMAVQDLAKPSAGPAAAAAFAQLHLSTEQLRSTLEEHGLNAALQLLKNHLDAAGITGSKVGGLLEDAFTKKAGAGLAILITRMAQFDEARKQEQDAAHGFGDAWKTTTHTLSFAMDRLKAEAQAAMITLGEKLLPAVTSVADWLGTHLPNAIHTLQSILQPLEHIVAGALTVAWRGLSDVVKVAGSALSAVGNFLASHRAVFTDVAVAVGTLWAAFKGYTIAVVALRLLAGRGGLWDALRLRAMYATDAVRNFGTKLTTLSPAAAAAGGAILALTAVVVGLTMRSQEQARQAALNKEAIDSYTAAIQADNNALGENVRAQAEKNLVDANAYQNALKMGISQKTLTDAVLGNKQALLTVINAMNTYSHTSGHSSDALFRLNEAIGANRYLLGKAKTNANDMAAANGKVAGASNTAATAQRNQAAAARQAAAAIKTLTTNFQNLINKELGHRQAQLAFKQGLLEIKQQLDHNNTSLSTNTDAGVKNRQMLLGLLGQAEQAAEGSKNYSKALQDNVQKFMAFTTNAGFSKAAVDKILGSLHLMPAQIKKAFAKPHLDVSGITSALGSTVDAAAIAGAQAGNNYAAAFRAALRIQSPSKVFMYFGKMLIEGLRIGWNSGFGKFYHDMTSPVQAAFTRLTDVLQAQVTRQQGILQKARDKLHGALQARRSAIGSLSGSISGSADLGGLFGTDVFGNPSVANVNTFLSGQAKKIENFAKDLKWGARHHLAPALLQEIANLGPDQGDQVLKEFMSGQASIKAANQAEATIQKYSRAAATTVEDRVYARRIAADRREVRHQTKVLEEIRDLTKQEARKAARDIATHVTIDAKTGRPVVDKKFIDDIIKGIRQHERTVGRKLL